MNYPSYVAYAAMMQPDDVPDLLALLTERPAWHRHAACRDQPSAIFFPARGESIEPAREICSTCPVEQDCRTWALEHSSIGGVRLVGVWAGLTGRERRKARQSA